MYNLMTAASAAGINRSTVLRAIKAGRISAQRDSNNGWQIDPAEFQRVLPPLPLPAGASAQRISNRPMPKLHYYATSSRNCAG